MKWWRKLSFDIGQELKKRYGDAATGTLAANPLPGVVRIPALFLFSSAPASKGAESIAPPVPSRYDFRKFLLPSFVIIVNL